jgi:O-acetyl-ADP-ribose deacetylase (regulator of RNase III)
VKLTARARQLLTRKHAPFIGVAAGDITLVHADVIVNAAKRSLLSGGGVDGAIHAAGGPAILAACQAIRDTQYPDGLPTGGAVATTAGRLPAQHVIHTVGPVYDADEDRADLLRSCYVESLKVADRLGAKTVAFPLISSGVYGWPVEDAIFQALEGISSGRYRSVERVTLILFDDDTARTAMGVYDRGGYWI